MGENSGLLRLNTLRPLESAALSSLAPGTLMRRAANALCETADALLRTQNPNAVVAGLIGPGNNGADALLTLMLLAGRGYAVRAFGDPDANIRQFGPEARRVHELWHSSEQPLLSLNDINDLFPGLHGSCVDQAGFGLVIDGLFGIGLQRPLSGQWARAAQLTHRVACPVLAVDLPSGLNPDTGAIVGGPRAAVVRATHTVTMIANKPGLFTGAGAALCGQVQLASLAVTQSTPDGILIDQNWAHARLKRRAANTHKGSFGTVGILGGAPSMPGAALLAASGARAAGAGKVTIMSPGHPVFDPANAQIMNWQILRPADLDLYLSRITTLVAGCGLSTDHAVASLLSRAMHQPLPAVLDADALNLIAAGNSANGLQAILEQRARNARTILTPHPLEAARLLGISTARVEQDRVDAAQRLARRYGAVIVLKGQGSVIAAPEGRWAICQSGSPALATGGTGDCLAGICGALLAQTYTPWEAAALATWVHGNAGQRWSVGQPRHIGMSVTDLMHHVVNSFNQT